MMIPSKIDAVKLAENKGWADSFYVQEAFHKFALGSPVKVIKGHASLTGGYSSGRVVKETKCYAWVMCLAGIPQKKLKSNLELDEEQDANDVDSDSSVHGCPKSNGTNINKGDDCDSTNNRNEHHPSQGMEQSFHSTYATDSESDGFNRTNEPKECEGESSENKYNASSSRSSHNDAYRDTSNCQERRYKKEGNYASWTYEKCSSPDQAESFKCNEKCDMAATATHHYTQAAIHIANNNYNDAIDNCSKAIALDPSFMRAYVRKAKAEVCLGNLKQATMTLYLAEIYSRDALGATVLNLRNSIIELQQKFYLAKWLLERTGDSQIVKGTFSSPNISDARDSIAQLEIICKSCPAWTDILILKTKAFVALGRWNDVLITSASFIAKESENRHYFSTISLYRAFAFQSMGNATDAVNELKNVNRESIDEKDKNIYDELKKKCKKDEANGFFRARSFEKAVDSYSDMLQMTNLTAVEKEKLYYNRAQARSYLRKHQDAIDDCTHALKLKKEFIKAFVLRAKSYLMIGAKKECFNAIQDYESVLKIAERSGNDAKRREMECKILCVRQMMNALSYSFPSFYPYKTLNIFIDAPRVEIKKSYRRLLLKWHPDKHVNNAKGLQEKAQRLSRELNRAYEFLNDVELKKDYDNTWQILRGLKSKRSS